MRIALASPSACDRKHEARRQFVVRAVIFLYILSLLEGPMRKWFLPGLAGPLTLLRDPFVIALYAYCLVNGLMLRRGIAGIWLSFAFATSTFGLVQYAASGFSVTGWMLGVRAYWLYMPLAFVVGQSFRQEDVMRFLRLNLWIALPYALLVAAQYSSGAAAFINRGVGGDEDGAVGVADGILRPFGLFTYTSPNVQFTATMIAMLLALFLGGRGERPTRYIFLAMAVAVATMSILTGSRAIYFQGAVMTLFAIAGLVVTRPSLKTAGRIIGIAGFVGLAGALFVQVFPDMLAAMQTRIEVAERAEGSLWARIYYSSFTFLEAFLTAPALGHGIGAGASGVSSFLGLPHLIFGESDTKRNVNELGVLLGLAMLVLRFATAVWLGMLALSLARRGTAAALPLAGFAMLPFVVGHITHSPVSAFPVWLAVGCIMGLGRSTDSRCPGQSANAASFRPALPNRYTSMAFNGSDNGL